ncbi:MAG: twin-arginine translocase subunit TatB [Alcanivoracaceae bacterium]|nr:twin-arginine translocase subunit TatB [Alcanivoracaceae bacterium]
MFDIGFFELLVIFVIALLVLGPERLPRVARQIGYWSGRARAAFNNLRYELEREAHNQEMQEKFRKQMETLGIDEKSLSGTRDDDTPEKAPAPDKHTNND